MTSQGLDPARIDAKWREIAPLIDRLMDRAGDAGDFKVQSGSALAGDDRHSDPYQVSHVFRQCFNVAADHLHAAKLLVVNLGVVHLAAHATLARSAIENAATAHWILQCSARNDRIMRSLRWHSRNIRDQYGAIPDLSPRTLDDQLEKVARVAAARGLKSTEATGGYKHSTVLDDVAQKTGLRVNLVWNLTSGLAHGRPWAYLGALEQQRLPTADADVLHVELRSDLTRALYPVLITVRLIESLLRLWEQRAGSYR